MLSFPSLLVTSSRFRFMPFINVLRNKTGWAKRVVRSKQKMCHRVSFRSTVQAWNSKYSSKDNKKEEMNIEIAFSQRKYYSLERKFWKRFLIPAQDAGDILLST